MVIKKFSARFPHFHTCKLRRLTHVDQNKAIPCNVTMAVNCAVGQLCDASPIPVHTITEKQVRNVITWL